MRQLTINLRSTVLGCLAVLALPVLMGLGAKWSARSEADQLRAANTLLQVENGSYRAATGELTSQIQSLETVINDLGARSQLDPAQARAMQKLPAVVKARAAGGASASSSAMADIAAAAMTTPENTFGALRDLLRGLESRLLYVRRDVERQEALANATPSIWPAHGWISSTVGPRRDPMNGGADYHAGLDIAGDRGQPVYATASGTVKQLGYQGAYGNLVTIDHGFGLESRYGHLLKYAVKNGEKVKRGDVIGYVGATGRATGSHLHYEILANGQLINPLRLLTQPAAR